MCGRYSLKTEPVELARLFQVPDPPTLPRRYNIAPSQAVTTVRIDPDAETRGFAALQWGLVPSWAEDPGIGNRLINARSETVSQKPAFRSAFKRRRCLIAADGFFEWKRAPSVAKGAPKQPSYIRLRDREPFAFAGLWERWAPREGTPGRVLETCTILTTSPNELMRPIHDRMPVILPPPDFDTWLDPRVHDEGALQALLGPFPADRMTATKVSTRVNSPRNDDAQCIQPVEQQGGLWP